MIRITFHISGGGGGGRGEGGGVRKDMKTRFQGGEVDDRILQLRGGEGLYLCLIFL